MTLGWTKALIVTQRYTLEHQDGSPRGSWHVLSITNSSRNPGPN
jgi:hypothetical protein